jgi:glycosyltransferase involved in cell wall biosynthesis
VQTGGAGRPSVSVVVPTRDRPTALEACLAALAAQTIADRLEVIVVDDGSVAADEVAAVVARHPNARLVRQSGSGPAAARNAGVREARGKTVCFTDDDCLPEANWVEELLVAIRAGADTVAGRTVNNAGALGDASEVISRAPAAVEPFAPSNNLACTKALLQAIPFDESYRQAAAEDRDWCARLVESGYTIHAQASAVVLHRPRLTLSSFLRRQVRYGQGAYLYRTTARRRLEPVGFYVALVRRGFARGIAVGMLVSVAQVATAFGWARGWLELRRERS